MKQSRQNLINLPDGPKTPVLLQHMQFVKDPVAYMEAAQKQYGDIFTTPVFAFHPGPALLLSNPQALRQVLTNDTREFSAPGELNKISVPWLGDYSMLFLDGESHRSQRQLLMPPFHGERLRDYGQTICDITETVISQQPIGRPFVSRALMRDVSLQIILEIVFGWHEGERCEQLKHLMLTLMEDFQDPAFLATGFFRPLQRDFGAWSPWGRFLRKRQQIDTLLFAEIYDRRANPDPDRTDILSLLLEARDQAGQPMTQQELRDQLVTLLFVGHENSATAIAWSLYWVHRHPEVLHKLLQELDSLGESADPMSLFRLPYLTAVCNETLRISPVNMFVSGRMVASPVELMGYQLQPGTAIFGSIYLTHHREDLYPEPKQFRPERFLERQFSPYEFLPFGGGNRSCVGATLAQFEMRLVLATLLSGYQLAAVDQRPERPQGRGIVLVPASGVKMVVQGQRIRQKQPSTAMVY